MVTSSSGRARFNRWTRDLHLYFGLFVSPFLLIFATTTILLNHRAGADVDIERSAATVNLDGIPEAQQADFVLAQLKLSGETMARRMPNQNRLQLVVARPADNHLIRVDLDTGAVEIERRVRDLLGVLIYLHFNPGPHKVHGVTWIFSKLWGWSVDAVVCLLLFLTLSGIYLWLLLRAERKIGLTLLAAGVACFAAIVTGFF
jgi:hypothetical protein